MQLTSRRLSPISLRARRSGFTLIELLTVIAIIGILAAILIPTVGAVRKKASTAKDSSNLRQIGVGLQLYANENKGSFPTNRISIPNTSLSASSGNRYCFQESIDRYLWDAWKSNRGSIYNFLGNEMWYSSYAEPFPTFSPSTGNNQTRPIAYSCNPYAYRADLYGTQWGGRTSIIPAPSQTVIIAEVNLRAPDGVGGAVKTTQTPPDNKGDVESSYRVNRDGKALYLFCDGRVSSLEGDQSEPALAAASKPNIWRWW